MISGVNQKCDRCGKVGSMYVMHDGNNFLCEDCHNVWAEECLKNGITGGVRDYKHFNFPDKDCHVKYWEYCFSKFCKKIKGEAFVFR